MWLDPQVGVWHPRTSASCPTTSGTRAWTTGPERGHGVARASRATSGSTARIVCLQEVWLGQLDDLRERLPAYEWASERRADAEHTPVGYRSDRLTLADHGVFALSATPGDLRTPGWDAALPRVTTRATLRTDRGTAFDALSTHFDHVGERARRESARLLARRVAGRSAVVAGDLDCGRGAEPYRRLTEGALADARNLAADPHGPDVTFHGFDGPRSGERLDHVLVTGGVGVDRYGVLTDAGADGRYPSDHFPVVVDLTVPADA